MSSVLVTINGNDEYLTEEVKSVEDLLISKQVDPEVVSVQLNNRILKREELSSIELNEGDQLDFVFFMGGGNSRRAVFNYIID